jgi:hypothetical protein
VKLKQKHDDLIDRDLTRHFVPETLDEAKYVIEQQSIYLNLLVAAILFNKNAMIFKTEEEYAQIIRYMDINLKISGVPPTKDEVK